MKITTILLTALLAAAAFARGDDGAAIKLFRLLDTAPDKNFVFSPYSALTAVQMAQMGAEGKTRAELDAALGEVAEVRDLGDKISVANAAFVDFGAELKADYSKQLGGKFAASVEKLDFTKAEAARVFINAWVGEKTREKITELLPPGILDSVPALVLVNAIYFKDSWKNEFKPSATRDAPFTTAGGGVREVRMMQQVEAFRYAETNGVQILAMPYANGGAMTLYLPGGNDLAPALELLGAPAELRVRRVDVSLPKFKMEANFSLVDAFKGLGIREAFLPTAEFDNIVEGGNLYISEIRHGVFVEVDERGTEAAAATAVIMPRGASISQPVKFTADRPFAFTISAADGTLLFAGAVREP